MKKFLSLSIVTLILASSITLFSACGMNEDEKNIDENGTLSEDVKDIMDDGDLDKNDAITNEKPYDSNTNDLTGDKLNPVQ